MPILRFLPSVEMTGVVFFEMTEVMVFEMSGIVFFEMIGVVFFKMAIVVFFNGLKIMFELVEISHLFENDRFPQNRFSCLEGKFRHFRMRFFQGCNLPQIISGPQHQHRHVSVRYPCGFDDFIPVNASCPIINY